MSAVSNNTKNSIRDTIMKYMKAQLLMRTKKYFTALREGWTEHVIKKLSPASPMCCSACELAAIKVLVPSTYTAIGCTAMWDCCISYDELTIEWPCAEQNESLMLMISNEVRDAQTVFVSYPYLIVETSFKYRVKYNLWDVGSLPDSRDGEEVLAGDSTRRKPRPQGMYAGRWIANEICAPGISSGLGSVDNDFMVRVLREIGYGMFQSGDPLTMGGFIRAFGCDMTGRPKIEHYQAVLAALYRMEERLPFGEITLFGSAAYYIFRAQCDGLLLVNSDDLPKDIDISVLVDDNVIDRERAFIDFVRIALSIMKGAIGEDWSLVEGCINVCAPQPHILRTEVIISNPGMGALRFDLSMRFKIDGEIVAPTPLVIRQCVAYRYIPSISGYKVLAPILIFPLVRVSLQDPEVYSECVPNEDTFYLHTRNPMSCLYPLGDIPRDQIDLVRRLQNRHGILTLMWTPYAASIIGESKETHDTCASFVELAGKGFGIIPTSERRSSGLQPQTIPGWDGFKVVRVLRNHPRDGY